MYVYKIELYNKVTKIVTLQEVLNSPGRINDVPNAPSLSPIS